MLVKTIYLYEDRQDVTLTTYVIGEKGELRGQGKRPAVLICPGGGYFNCSDREAEPVALQFNAMGYHAFVLKYSTYTRGREEFPDIFGKAIKASPKTAHPAPVREVGMAMLSIREHSKEWNLDPDRVAVCGFSAGGHNAAMYGVYWDKPLLTDYLGVDKEMIRPAALILGYGLSDYIYMKRRNFENPMDEKFFSASNKAYLGEENPQEDMLYSVSPARLVTNQTPPAYIWATCADKLVPVQHSIRMAHALAEYKVPFELHIFEEGEHGLSLATQACAVAQSQIDEDAAKWVSLAAEWLKKRFALQLPPKTSFEEMFSEKIK